MLGPVGGRERERERETPLHIGASLLAVTPSLQSSCRQEFGELCDGMSNGTHPFLWHAPHCSCKEPGGTLYSQALTLLHLGPSSTQIAHKRINLVNVRPERQTGALDAQALLERTCDMRLYYPFQANPFSPTFTSPPVLAVCAIWNSLPLVFQMLKKKKKN